MPNTTKPAFTWEEFENGKIAVKCYKKPLAKLFLKLCEIRSMKWTSGDRVICADGKTITVKPPYYYYCYETQKRRLTWSCMNPDNRPEVNLTDILTIRESEPAPEPE